MHINHQLLPFLLAVLLFTVDIIAAPFALEPYTVEDLDGAAWQIDNAGAWDEMSILPRLAYYTGDIICHQKQERSYTLNGNKMPVCARDIGMLVGLNVGFTLALAAVPSATFQGTFQAMLPFIRRRRAIGAVFAILLIPLPLDGFLQLLTAYESNNVLRTNTGLLFGIGIALLISLFLLTDPRRHR